MNRKTIVDEEAATGYVPALPASGQRELDAAAERDLEAFQSVSRKSRRAVAETIQRLVRPA